MESSPSAQHQASTQNPPYIHSSEWDSAQGSGRPADLVTLLMSEQGVCFLRALLPPPQGSQGSEGAAPVRDGGLSSQSWYKAGPSLELEFMLC